MRLLIPILILLLVIFYCAITFAAPQNDPPPRPNDLKPGNHYFTTDWCSACQKQAPIIKQLQDQGFVINIHKDPKIFKNMNIKKIPMLIIVKVNEKGRRIYIRLTDIRSIEKLKKILIK